MKINYTIILSVFFVLGSLISCAENPEMIKRKQIEEQNAATQIRKTKNEQILKNALTEMTSKYVGIMDLNNTETTEWLVRAYNNPEENPDILNSTTNSENEFQHLKDLEIYKEYRSKKYVTIGCRIFADELNKYDFKNKQFTIAFESINIMSPEGNIIYNGKKPPYVDLVIKNNKMIVLSIEPEEAEKLKDGLKGIGNPAFEFVTYKDIAYVYYVLEIKGKDKVDDRQNISANIVDYTFIWFIDGGPTRDDRDALEATEIRIFKK